MKKYLFIALAAAGMLSSCSSDDIVSNGENSGNEESRQQILIGLGQTVTRGTGTVGGFDADASNKWNKQVVNIYMLKKGTMDLALVDPEKNPVPIYDNMTFYTPELLTKGQAIATNNAISYYPTQGKYDFWGYRLDDAVTATPQPVRDAESIYVDFTIDGTQDVMVAKAVPSDDDKAKLIAGGNTTADRAYSAFAARNDVQPDLLFKHQLSRLTFEVIPGNANTVDMNTPVVVTGIEVESPTSGRLTIAATEDVAGEKQAIVWNYSDLSILPLKQRPEPTTPGDNNAYEKLINLTPKSLAGETVGTPVPVGEALLVAPGVQQYNVKVYLSQKTKKAYGNDDTETREFSYTDVIQLNPVADFAKGYSYNVQITLYGLQEIKVNTTLEEWKDGAPIPLTPEDKVY